MIDNPTQYIIKNLLKKYGLNAFMEDLGYANVARTAERWGTTRHAVHAMIRRGQIEDFVKVGNDNYISIYEDKPTKKRKE